MDVVGTFPIPIDEIAVGLKYYLYYRKRKNRIQRASNIGVFPKVAVLMAVGPDVGVQRTCKKGT